MDLRIQKTLKAIRSTFIEMICEMDYQDITIRELTERAQINRKTFYLHYETIDDLVGSLVKEIVADYESQLDKLPRPRSRSDVNRVFFTYFSSQGEYVEKLICDPSYAKVCDKLFRAVTMVTLKENPTFNKLNNEQKRVVAVWTNESTLAIYRQWVQRGKRISLEEIIELSDILLTRGFDGVIDMTHRL